MKNRNKTSKAFSQMMLLVIMLVIGTLVIDSVAARYIQSPNRSVNIESLSMQTSTIKIDEVALTLIGIDPVIDPQIMLSMSDQNAETSDQAPCIMELSLEIPEEIKQIESLIPKKFEEAESSIRPLRNRFLMWTHDLKHVMWGYYRNGFFIGEDNCGKHCWGVYRDGFFAGRYDGELFWGKYTENSWKAKNLFDESKTTHGKYLVAPVVIQAVYAEILPFANTKLSQRTVKIAEDTQSLLYKIPSDILLMKDNLPSLEEAELGVHPMEGRYLLWTRDLKDVMWGFYGNGFFVGSDNHYKRSWGIYGEGVFAGLYAGSRFFYGFYGSGRWRAYRLFGEPFTGGRYLLSRITE